MANINVNTVLIDCTEWEEELENFIESFDADVSGQNGSEYTLQEALDEGFESSVEYWINEATKKYPHTSEIDDVSSMVCYVLEQVANTYPDGANFDIFKDVPNDILSIAFASV